MKPCLLELKDLKGYYLTGKGTCKAVDGVSFRIEPEENFGIVGESGCGKTSLIKTILKVFPNYFRIAGGQILSKDVTSFLSPIRKCGQCGGKRFPSSLKAL